MAGKSRADSGEFPCTKEEIVQLRDVERVSWKDIAIRLDLKSPAGRPYGRYAKQVYSALTGVPYEDLRTRGTGGNGAVAAPRRRQASPHNIRPQWDDDSDQGEIEDMLAGECHMSDKGERWRPVRIFVRRSYGNMSYLEEIAVRYVTAFTYGPGGDQPLQVEVVEHMTVKDRGGSTWEGTQIRTLFVSKIEEIAK